MQTVDIRRPSSMQGKVSLEVQVELYRLTNRAQADYAPDGFPVSSSSGGDSITDEYGNELLVSATGIYKRLGALRAF
jgi:hypothetical protein